MNVARIPFRGIAYPANPASGLRPGTAKQPVRFDTVDDPVQARYAKAIASIQSADGKPRLIERALGGHHYIFDGPDIDVVTAGLRKNKGLQNALYTQKKLEARYIAACNAVEDKRRKLVQDYIDAHPTRIRHINGYRYLN